MRSSLARWIGDADALRHLEHFHVVQSTLDLANIRFRADEYYVSLVGELFERIREGYADTDEWARLGNALALFGDSRREDLKPIGVSADEASLFAAAAFYFGGFPASANLTIRERAPVGSDEAHLACFDLLARPSTFRSITTLALLDAMRSGNLSLIDYRCECG